MSGRSVEKLRQAQTQVLIDGRPYAGGTVIRTLVPSSTPKSHVNRKKPWSSSSMTDRPLTTRITRVAEPGVGQAAAGPEWIVEHELRTPTHVHLDWFWR